MSGVFPARDTIATYGGPFNDYAPVIDPTTDMSSGGTTGTGGNQFLADVGALCQTPVSALVRFTLAGAGAPTIVAYYAAWQSTTAPTVVYNGSTGQYLVTFPGTVLDQLSNVQTLNLFGASAQCESATAQWTAQCAVSGGNAVTVSTFQGSSSGSPNGPTFLLVCY